MTTATLTLPRLPESNHVATPFSRLTRVELRKQLDTRAGQWLLITIGLVTAAVVTIMFFVGGGDHSYSAYVGVITTPLMLGVPIIGVLAATSEWSQRTGLATFALEPRRGRVVAAKAISSLILGVLTVVVGMALAAIVHGSAVTFRGATADWGIEPAVVAGLALVTALSVVQGVAFGLATLSTPVAIVTLLLVPTLWSILGSLITAAQEWMPWVDMSTAAGPLLAGTMAGQDWAHLASSSAIWVALPLLIGLVRVLRSEVK